MALGQQRITPVRDFLKLSLSDTSKYVVRGVVTKVRSTVSASFFLKDDTGDLLVYGLQDGSGQGRTFKLLDIAPSDTVTVCGRFTIYNGTTKEMKDGVLLDKADGPDHNMSFAFSPAVFETVTCFVLCITSRFISGCCTLCTNSYTPSSFHPFRCPFRFKSGFLLGRVLSHSPSRGSSICGTTFCFSSSFIRPQN